MTTVACVLRSGGDFDWSHVARLALILSGRVPESTLLCCLTDQPEEVSIALGPDTAMRFFGFDIEVMSLIYGWPGWWSKLEAFRLPGPVLYLDLDVSIIGDLTPLLQAAQEHDFITSANFWVEDPHKINSSVMAWRGDASALYREFAAAPDAHRSIYNVPERWGDQAFIADHWPGRMETWQDLLPGAVCSYKRGALMGEDLSDCRVLASHGVPRPWAPGGADEWLIARGIMVA